MYMYREVRVYVVAIDLNFIQLNSYYFSVQFNSDTSLSCLSNFLN